MAMSLHFSKNKIREIVNSYHRFQNRVHYLKWELQSDSGDTKDWSIRYFFVFDAKKKLVHKYVLKSHITKEYIELSISEALDYIRYMAVSVKPIEFFSVNEKGGYRRAIIHHGDQESKFMLKTLTDWN